MLKALPLLINSWSIADRHDADGAVVCCFCILRKLTEALTPQGAGFFCACWKRQLFTDSLQTHSTAHRLHFPSGTPAPDKLRSHARL